METINIDNEIEKEIINEFEKVNFNKSIILFDKSQHSIEIYRWISYYDDKGDLISIKPTINSDNFRGKNYSIEKSSNVKRVVVIGDSHTFGWGLKDEETFPYKLEELLNNQILGYRWEVLNMGYPGINLIEKLQVLKYKGIKYNPDIVILQHDGDDIFPQLYRQWEQQIFNNLSTKYNISFSLKRDFIRYFTHTREKIQYKIGYKFLLNELIENPILEFKNISGQIGFKLLILSFYPTDDQDKIIRKHTENGKIPYLVINSILNPAFYKISKYEPHLNGHAHEIIAKKIYDVITHIIYD